MRDPHVWGLIAVFVGVLATMRVLAGRLSARVIVAPIVFLVTRIPVLIAWGIGTLAMLALILLTPQPGKHPENEPFFLLALCAFSGLGFAALVVGPVFMLMRVFAKPPEVALEPGEAVAEEILANHFLGGEARGGKLLVTNRRLIFRPHRFNVQLDLWAARLTDLRATRREGLRFLLVTTADGADAWLVVQRPDELAARLAPLLPRPA